MHAHTDAMWIWSLHTYGRRDCDLVANNRYYLYTTTVYWWRLQNYGVPVCKWSARSPGLWCDDACALVASALPCALKAYHSTLHVHFDVQLMELLVPMCIYTYMHICIHTHTCIYVYTQANYTYIHIYIYIYIYANIRNNM